MAKALAACLLSQQRVLTKALEQDEIIGVLFVYKLFSYIVCAGKHLFAVVNSIFLGHSEGKTINLDTLETESVWSPSKVHKAICIPHNH